VRKDNDSPFAEIIEAWGKMSTSYAAMMRPFMEAMAQVPILEAGKDFLATLDLSPDPARVQELWKGALKEYQADMDGLADTGAKTDMTSLTRAWASLLSGRDDTASKETLERMLEVAAVKARFGPEYYADPDTTEVAPTPRNLVERHGPLDLFRFDPGADAPPRQGAPVLLVYSLINRTYILDLMAGFSFVQHLLDQGLDVFVFEWREEERTDSDVELDEFVDELIDGCVDSIRGVTGADTVSLLGHCMGGPFAALYTALHPDKVDRLMGLTAPFTANEGGVVAMWTDRELFAVDAIVDRLGYVPGKTIRHTFIAFKPYLEVMRWKMFLENVGNEQVMGLFNAVDKWTNDTVDVPGEVFRQLMVEIYREDRLRRGETRIHDTAVDLGTISCPVLSLAADKDWIVSPASARVLNDLVSSKDNRYEVMPGGHVSMLVDPRNTEWWSTISDFFLESKGPAKKKKTQPKQRRKKTKK
jgi:polyhydroxyalkanoate synthase